MATGHNVQLTAEPLPALEMPSTSPLDSLFLRRPGSGITLPFQFVIYQHTSAAKYITSSILSFQGITDLTKHGRLCTLSQLECVIAPMFSVSKYPTSIDVTWTSNDVIPNSNNIMNYPSATRITLGGPLVTGPSIIKCPFGYINPIIKAPLAFTDFARISLNCTANPTGLKEAGEAVLASVLLRGEIHIAHPASALSSSPLL